MKKIILAGGCFWGVQHYLRQIDGVTHTVVGYAGGDVSTGTYTQVCTGTTNHAEAIQVTYNPDIVSLDTILGVFFQIHDPTTPNRQGNDVGSQYRSAIFYTTQDDKHIAENRIARMQQSGKWGGTIITTLNPLITFVIAEDNHQDYLIQNPDGYNCHFPRPDWVLD